MRALAVIGALSLFCGACHACAPEGVRVPFGIDAGEGPGPVVEAPPQGEAPFEPKQGEELPEGTTRVQVEGAPLAVGAGSIRAVLALDLDADGDRDALVMIQEADGVRLVHARREGPGFDPPRELATRPADEGCELFRAGIRTVAPEYALATTDWRCGDATARSVWIVSLEAQPRVRERVALLPSTSAAGSAVSIALRAVDQDGDGHADVVLDVSVATPDGQEAQTVSIAWLDRPGGLARDTSEPEATLQQLARRARRALAHDPEAALRAARRVLTVHGALCREGGNPRVRFGDSAGLACGASVGAGSAAATATMALARQGRVFDALVAAERLDEPAYRLGPAERRAAERALDAMPSPEGLVRHAGPTVHLAAAPRARLSALGFLDEDRLIVRGTPPVILDAHTLRPLGGDAEGDRTLRDPSGALTVASVGRSCAGYVLRIVRSADVIAGVVAGPPLGEPLIEPRPAPPEARCPRVPAPVRDEDGGWRVLGWAPQGVVAARGLVLRLVPLTLDGSPAGPPIVLDGDTLPPAPVPPGAMSSRGEAFAVATPQGIAVVSLAPTNPTLAWRTVLFRPAQWQGAGATDVAVSPSASSVAYLRGGRLYVVDHGAPSEGPAAAGPAGGPAAAERASH